MTIGHCTAGSGYFKMKGSVIMISADVTKTIEKILPVMQNLIPVSFKRKLVYSGHYIREYIDKKKLIEYFRFFKTNNHLYEDLSLGDLEKVEEELCSAVGEKEKTDGEEDMDSESKKPDLESEVPMSQHSLILDKYMESTDGKTVAKKVASMIHDFENLHNITEEEEENEQAANDPEENWFPEDEREDFEEENSFLVKLHSLDVKLEDKENWATIAELEEMFRSWKRKPRLHLADHFCSLVKQEAHLVSLKNQLLKLKSNNSELQDLIVSALDDVAESIEETTAKRVSTIQCCHQDDDVIDHQLDQILKSNADTDRTQQFVRNQVKQIEKNLQDIINVAPGEEGNFHSWGSDIYLEEKLFPQLFPYGIGGYLSSNLLRKEDKKLGFSNYCKNRILSILPKYREDKDYIFFLLIVKEQLEMRRSERTYFRKAAKIPSLTPAVLSQQSPEMLSRYNSLYRTLKNLRGSACYFQDVQKRLMAFLRQKGAPTLFVTFSAAEFDWDDMALKIYETVTNKPSTLEFIRSQSHSWRNKLVQDNVVQSTIHFSKRIEKIISYLNNNHLLEYEGVQYTVVSYFFRIEYQVIFL
jgi:hypothetical protein